MKCATLPKIKFKGLNLLSLFLLTLLLTAALPLVATAQQQQTVAAKLSLADLLIGLRSKKATLPERNKILTDAVKERGITFALTPEIEKELSVTGADMFLIDAVRQKSPLPKPAQIQVSLPKPTVVSTPVPTPDFAFYQARANEKFVKGEYDSAVNDYSKAIDLNPKEVSAYMNRGLALFNKKNYEQAISDYDKAIELSPKDSMLYLNRGNAHEKAGDLPKAISDYQKALDLDASNETAKLSLQRLESELAKTLPPKPTTTPLQQQPPQQNSPVTNSPVNTETKVAPQSIELGSLIDRAVKLVKPVYSPEAQKFSLGGMIVVQVTLDEEGNVTSAKATSGPALLRAASEDAARKSKFKPAMFGDKAVKSTGFMSYNFKAN